MIITALIIVALMKQHVQEGAMDKAIIVIQLVGGKGLAAVVGMVGMVGAAVILLVLLLQNAEAGR